jgi:acyl carrier protein
MTHDQMPSPSKGSIETWLARWIADSLGVPVEEIGTTNSLLDFSLSSVNATMLVGDLEDWLGLTLPPTLVWDYASIDALADYLVGQLQAGSATLTAPIGSGPDDRSLLSNIDQLSDQEVSVMLDQLMAGAQAVENA